MESYINESVNREERNLAMYCHLASLAGAFCPPFHLIATLIIWLSNRDQSEFVNQQGKEALNFQITMLILYVMSAFLVIFLIGIPLLIVLYLLNIILPIVAIIRVNEGVEYRYPFRFKII